MGKKRYIDELEGANHAMRVEFEEMVRERDFLADQVSKLETVIDDKQAVIDSYEDVSAKELL